MFRSREWPVPAPVVHARRMPSATIHWEIKKEIMGNLEMLNKALIRSEKGARRYTVNGRCIEFGLMLSLTLGGCNSLKSDYLGLYWCIALKGTRRYWWLY